MATRDRTALFVQYRASFTKSGTNSTRNRRGLQDVPLSGPVDFEDQDSLLPEKHVKFNSNDKEIAIEMTQLPPRWMDIVDEIEDGLKGIKDKIQQVDAMHKKHLLPGFSDSSSDEEAIEELYVEITKMLNTAGKKVKNIAAESARSDSKYEQMLARNVQSSLASKLQDLSSQFRKAQTTYLQKIRGRDSRGQELYQDFAGKVDFTQTDSPTANQIDANFSMGYTEKQMGLLHENDQAIDQRSKEIMDIVKSINELAEIFRDMQTLVIDQGTLLDRIDYNIEQVSVSMKAANRELVAGEKYQKKAQSRYCIIGLGLLIIILLIIAILKPRK